ncbi:hypothetical protein GE061_006982 [Apolygus lucorum]|uniref:Uncharacterized protein n=1 Tax=Apolygus lucorum TaxID=248454 RepID=A0A8S9WRY7_APOLU|nr:hypothetical protein GE061_006982 [Apolygus lucorum]
MSSTQPQQPPPAPEAGGSAESPKPKWWKRILKRNSDEPESRNYRNFGIMAAVALALFAIVAALIAYFRGVTPGGFLRVMVAIAYFRGLLVQEHFSLHFKAERLS